MKSQHRSGRSPQSLIYRLISSTFNSRVKNYFLTKSSCDGNTPLSDMILYFHMVPAADLTILSENSPVAVLLLFNFEIHETTIFLFIFVQDVQRNIILSCTNVYYVTSMYQVPSTRAYHLVHTLYA